MAGIKDYESMAAALFDGGWRSEDGKELKEEYDLTDEELEKICELLHEFNS
jgi:hypothetical protein